MGVYTNKGNGAFTDIRRGEYIDKTGLIGFTNKCISTESRYMCVTRGRRFGKSMAVDMLCAYYDKSCDSRQLFEGLYIAEPDKEGEDRQFEKHLNRYPVLRLDLTDFLTKSGHDEKIVSIIQNSVIKELLRAYPEVESEEDDDLMDTLIKIRQNGKGMFIALIDEWDAICREFEDNKAVMDTYINLMRRLFKGSASKDVFALAYITGILPIKRYNTESALNNFREYSMTKATPLETFFGFTTDEAADIATKHDMSIEDLKAWYDGYKLGEAPSIYNPFSVMEAVQRRKCDNWWAQSGAYSKVSQYIQMNYEGLKDDMIGMLSGAHCKVDIDSFDNDPGDLLSKDNVMTILIHLGYLAYDSEERECYIPNREVREVMERAVRDCHWNNLTKVLRDSEQLLEATLAMDEEAVARGIDLAHDENVSILSYNNENSLSCVLSIAYIFARNKYTFVREMPTGKGFADIVLIPRRGVDTPAILLELKYDKSARTAMDQIREKRHPASLADMCGEVLMVGINYDKETKTHTCTMERVEK